MSFLIDLAKAFNRANTELIIATQNISSAIESLKPYSACVAKEKESFVPSGKYKRVYLKGEELIIKGAVYERMRRVEKGIYIPKDISQRIFIKTNLDRLAKAVDTAIALAKTKDSLKSLVDLNADFYPDDYEVSRTIKSINFENRTSEQTKYLNDLTERQLKEDKEAVIHSWIKYYPYSYCCYSVNL